MLQQLLLETDLFSCKLTCERKRVRQYAHTSGASTGGSQNTKTSAIHLRHPGKHLAQVLADPAGLGPVPDHLQQVLVPDEVEAREGRALPLEVGPERAMGRLGLGGGSQNDCIASSLTNEK